MKLETLLKDLAMGELNNFYMAETGSIDAENLPRVLSAINQSLTDVYTRFVLEEKELHILCFASKTMYPLQKKHATTDPTPHVPKYILDTHEYPFTGDLVQILSVTDEMGYTVTMNDRGKYGSVFIPRYDTIQVTNPSNNKMLAVTYQATHAPLFTDINTCSNTVMNQEVNISPLLEEALRARIASRVFSSMMGKEYVNKAGVLDAKYEALCAEAEQRNLINGSAFTTTCKLESRGFV